MSAEFVDTNVLVYAHDGGAGAKHAKSVDLLSRLLAKTGLSTITEVVRQGLRALALKEKVR